jgi:hypothetical protein
VLKPAYQEEIDISSHSRKTIKIWFLWSTGRGSLTEQSFEDVDDPKIYGILTMKRKLLTQKF